MEKLRNYLDSGGTLGVIGRLGIRDENYRPRKASVTERLRQRGRMVDLTPTPYFEKNRTAESKKTRATTQAFVASVRKALDGDLIIEGDLPRMLWVKTWKHDRGVASFHFVNYDIDFKSGRATPTAPTRLAVRLPEGIRAEEAQFIVPGRPAQALTLESSGERVSFELPSVRVYGIVLIGPRGLDRAASDIAQGDALLARARMACGGEWGKCASAAATVKGMRPSTAARVSAREYAKAASVLLANVAKEQDAATVAKVQAMADIRGAVVALDFGGDKPTPGWKRVAPDTTYSAAKGFGWLPAEDRTDPMPEELYYGNVRLGKIKTPYSIHPGHAIFWPYRPRPPAPVYRALACGGPRSFRIDLSNGLYEVRVVNMNPFWNLHNFRVSGMVWANGAAALLDVPLYKGSLVSRSFTTRVKNQRLDSTFGGPTGWGVAAVVVRRAEKPIADPLAVGSIREWKVSPRFANPDWYPIEQMRGTPEFSPDSPDTQGWVPVRAPREGIGVVNLGTNRETDTGDMVYAVAAIDVDRMKSAVLHVGASSSAIVWLNGKRVAFIPNQKGVVRDEFAGRVGLKAGRNVLLLKLRRFWERQWMFYASVTAAD